MTFAQSRPNRGTRMTATPLPIGIGLSRSSGVEYEPAPWRHSSSIADVSLSCSRAVSRPVNQS